MTPNATAVNGTTPTQKNTNTLTKSFINGEKEIGNITEYSKVEKNEKVMTEEKENYHLIFMKIKIKSSKTLVGGRNLSFSCENLNHKIDPGNSELFQNKCQELFGTYYNCDRTVSENKSSGEFSMIILPSLNVLWGWMFPKNNVPENVPKNNVSENIPKNTIIPSKINSDKSSAELKYSSNKFKKINQNKNDNENVALTDSNLKNTIEKKMSPNTLGSFWIDGSGRSDDINEEKDDGKECFSSFLEGFKHIEKVGDEPCEGNLVESKVHDPKNQVDTIIIFIIIIICFNA